MKKEVELQIIIKNPKEVEKKINKVGKFVGVWKQVDKYFVPPYRDFLLKNRNLLNIYVLDLKRVKII